MEPEEDTGFFADLEQSIVRHADFLSLLEENFNSKKQRYVYILFLNFTTNFLECIFEPNDQIPTSNSKLIANK
jgi:hypothetical protein